MRAERTVHTIAQRRVGTLELFLDEKGVPVSSLVTAYDIRDLVGTEERIGSFVLLDYNILSGANAYNTLNMNEVRNTDHYKARVPIP